MNRGIAILLAVIGGAAVSLAAVMALTAVLYGFLWIFVFGDDPWPNWVDGSLNILIPLIGLALWAMAGWAIWTRLRQPAGLE